ncbi:MAG TPA: prepilin-type N-terminal cleavage/methylation domain-containing protein, partial [Casimicrobiaceae bacterium]
MTARIGLRRAVGGFTLIELMVALVLLALMGSVLLGSLSLASRSLEGGEQKAVQTSGMRLGEEFLRSQLEATQPTRLRKVAEFPLLFAGERDELRFASAPVARAAGAGVWYYRLAVVPDGNRAPLVLQRTFADVNALDPPDFAEAERSVLL